MNEGDLIQDGDGRIAVITCIVLCFPEGAIARDNGSISSYSATDGTLNWFTIISSRSGRNDLESQRDAEMQISIDNEKLYYGHFQGELTALDRNNGNIIWTSPFSFINDIIINDNAIYGSTSGKELVSIDQASGFLNWRSKISSEEFTKPFIAPNNKDKCFIYNLKAF